jgi:hypothetical protein
MGVYPLIYWIIVMGGGRFIIWAYGGTLLHNVMIFYGRNKSWKWAHTFGENYGLSVFSSSIFCVCLTFGGGGVRQGWEQERTTCSGGYPSATCSAFLHYCESYGLLLILLWGIIVISSCSGCCLVLL